MNFSKKIERYFKKRFQNLLKFLLKPDRINIENFNPESVSKILLVRQDSRLGNLVLMTPLLSALKRVFINARIDVLVSEGFEDVLKHNPNIRRIITFRKKRSRIMPWLYLSLIYGLKKGKYNLAVDVSDGNHFSFNNVTLTSLCGAKYRLGFDRGDAKYFLNLVVEPPPGNMYMADAMLYLAKIFKSELEDFPMEYHLSDNERDFAETWLKSHNINEFDSFFTIHCGGKGRKRWGSEKFASLINRLADEIGVKIVLIVGKTEEESLKRIQENTKAEFEILRDVKVGEMAAVIERCSMFISGDTGPMHVSVALNRPTVGLFTSSNFHVYGPRGKNSRIVLPEGESVEIDDVMIAVLDLIEMKES